MADFPGRRACAKGIDRADRFMPSTRGYCSPSHWPSFTNESLWQMPQAWTLIRTQPGPGFGIGLSTISNGPPARVTGAARILDMIASWFVVRSVHCHGQLYTRVSLAERAAPHDQGGPRLNGLNNHQQC